MIQSYNFFKKRKYEHISAESIHQNNRIYLRALHKKSARRSKQKNIFTASNTFKVDQKSKGDCESNIQLDIKKTSSNYSLKQEPEYNSLPNMNFVNFKNENCSRKNSVFWFNASEEYAIYDASPEAQELDNCVSLESDSKNKLLYLNEKENDDIDNDCSDILSDNGSSIILCEECLKKNQENAVLNDINKEQENPNESISNFANDFFRLISSNIDINVGNRSQLRIDNKLNESPVKTLMEVCGEESHITKILSSTISQKEFVSKLSDPRFRNPRESNKNTTEIVAKVEDDSLISTSTWNEKEIQTANHLNLHQSIEIKELKMYFVTIQTNISNIEKNVLILQNDLSNIKADILENLVAYKQSNTSQELNSIYNIEEYKSLIDARLLCKKFCELEEFSCDFKEYFIEKLQNLKCYLSNNFLFPIFFVLGLLCANFRK